ncbi:MAG TPA: hypothetical protein ENI34_09600 [candidate division WOR-3 bacterium]|uniref:Methionine synthase n=1 Tax=candidate division WOR-3 bacterium TaxID=2052148 RepID=A0A9C9EPC7_UNCW3|nr:hypothetical protein [candidate division WOR-3 bacterium]
MRGGLKNILKRKILLLDGATGTNLLDKGLMPGESPSALNIRNPEAVFNIQKAYVDAGADAILTNTFSANPMNIESKSLNRVIKKGVMIAKRAAGKRAFVIGDVGPLGELIKPYGDFSFDEAYRVFYSIIRILSKAGVKIFLLETFTSIIEAKAAFHAARKFSDDVFVSFSLQDNGRTLMGELPETIAVTFEALGARAVGINCSLPDIILDAISRMKGVVGLPLIAKPNAGRIRMEKNRVHHTLSDRDVARYYSRFLKAGAGVIGGCCGTTPSYIKYLSRKSRQVHRCTKGRSKVFILASPQRILKVDGSSPVVIGERLNPSGRKRLKRELCSGNYSSYGEDAEAQEAAGAEILDVNAFVVTLNEEETMERAVFEILKNSHLPLSIDTQNFSAAKRILSFYPGVGIYNSVPARVGELKKWLPMIKEFGFKAVISLIGKKIPETFEERMANVVLALKVAQTIGFPKEDLIFDPLVFAAATDRLQIEYTLRCVATLHKKGLKTILGISNVSFGLPERSHLNGVLAAAAIKAGVTFLIVNPLDRIVMGSISAAKALFKGDITGFIERSKMDKDKVIAAKTKVGLSKSLESFSLSDAIIKGDVEASPVLAEKLLASGRSARDLIDHYISKSLKVVGEYYEKGEYFIPDLLKSAEAAKAALDVIKAYLPKKKKKARVILATVKGDIHDIGKNIALMIFESAGYEVVDLGKDVAADKIIKAVEKYRPIAVGLSALLTTTMGEMEVVVRELRKTGLNVKVIIGGPNVSDEYARKIGAYGAASNVLDGLKLLKQIR